MSFGRPGITTRVSIHFHERQSGRYGKSWVRAFEAQRGRNNSPPISALGEMRDMCPSFPPTARRERTAAGAAGGLILLFAWRSLYLREGCVSSIVGGVHAAGRGLDDAVDRDEAVAHASIGFKSATDPDLVGQIWSNVSAALGGAIGQNSLAAYAT
jgi:hypothetical protein